MPRCSMSYLVYIIRWAWRPRDIDVCLLVTAEEGPWKRALCWLWADSSLDKICWRSGGCRASKLLEDVANDHQALLAQGRIHTHTCTIHAYMHKDAFHACTDPHRETNITSMRLYHMNCKQNYKLKSAKLLITEVSIYSNDCIHNTKL